MEAASRSGIHFPRSNAVRRREISSAEEEEDEDAAAAALLLLAMLLSLPPAIALDGTGWVDAEAQARRDGRAAQGEAKDVDMRAGCLLGYAGKTGLGGS